MDLQYKGVNNRSGRKEWIERDLASSFRPEGLVMEEWQVDQYKPFVEGVRTCIGRDLTKDELSTIAWLAGYEQSTIDNIMSLIKSANLKDKENVSKVEKCSTCKGAGYLFYGTGDDTVCDECGGIGHMPVYGKL